MGGTGAAVLSHRFARHCPDPAVKRQLAQVRFVEAQQQKVVNRLLPGLASVLETTIAYEQVAVDLTAWVARTEPDPYLKQAYQFGGLEDFGHLYHSFMETESAPKIKAIWELHLNMELEHPPRGAVRSPVSRRSAHREGHRPARHRGASPRVSGARGNIGDEKSGRRVRAPRRPSGRAGPLRRPIGGGVK
ncbi:hypothetical protein [Streptosporangium sp. NPDC048865]|uniref:hypothetical protein n=1 Tax=Streptosporangium sp. NPDC048865 TaxID=3155766 RepID=UPI00342E671B